MKSRELWSILQPGDSTGFYGKWYELGFFSNLFFFLLLTNPPEGDRSGGGAGLGFGGVKEKLWQKRDEERVGPRGDWLSKAPSEVAHRD